MASAKPKPQKPERGWLNKQDMAASFGVSLTAFDKWNVEPAARIGRHVYYRAADVLDNRKAKWSTALATQRAAEETPMPSALEAEKERMLLIRAQREGQELKNAQTRRELAPVAMIEWALGKVGGQISALLESIPLRVKKMVPRLQAAEIELIKREVVKAQNLASRVTVDFDEYDESRTDVRDS